VFAVDNVDDGGSSTPTQAKVRFKEPSCMEEDPDAIELLLDPVQLNKTGASGDAAPGEFQSSSRQTSDGPGRPGFWKRIRHQWRDFRVRFARRFSRMFNRRRYRASTAASMPTDQEDAPAGETSPTPGP